MRTLRLEGEVLGMTAQDTNGAVTEPARPDRDMVAAYMDAVAERDTNLVLLVAHGGTIINIITWWLRLDISSLSKISFDAAPTSISVLRTNDCQKRTIERFNDTAHLYKEGLAKRIYPDL